MIRLLIEKITKTTVGKWAICSFVSVPIMFFITHWICNLYLYFYCVKYEIRFPFEGMPFLPFVVFVFSLVGWFIFAMLFNFSLIVLGEFHRTLKPIVEQWNVLKPMEIVEDIKELGWKEKTAKIAFLIVLMLLFIGIAVSALSWLIFGWPGWYAILGFVFSFAIFATLDPKFNPELTKMRRIVIRSIAISLALCGFAIGFSTEAQPGIVTFFLCAVLFAPFFWLVNVVVVYKEWHLPICSLYAVICVALCQVILLGGTSSGEVILQSVKYGGGVPVSVKFEESGGAEEASTIEGTLILRSNEFLFVESGQDTKEIALDHVRVIDYP